MLSRQLTFAVRLPVLDRSSSVTRFRAAICRAMSRTDIFGVPDSAPGARGLVERSAQPPGELDGIVVRPEVHEEKPGLLVQHVAVNRRDLDAVRTQGLDDRVDLVGGEHEIAGDRSLAAAGWLEADPGRQAQRGGWCERHALFGDLIAPGYAKLVDAAVV